MIAPELVKELQRLTREERLEVIRFLNAKLADEEGREWDDLLSRPGQVFRVPSVWVDFRKAGPALREIEEQLKKENLSIRDSKK